MASIEAALLTMLDATTGAQVDPQARIIKGYRVMTLGKLRGKGFEADLDTLKAICSIGNAAKDGIRNHVNHPEGAEISNDLRKLVGFSKNFRVDGDAVLADCVFLSEKAAPDADQLLALAAEAPGIFGASVVSLYKLDKNKMRPMTLEAIDFVDIPAGNPRGLFTASQETPPMPEEKKDDAPALLEAEGEGEATKHFAKCDCGKRFAVCAAKGWKFAAEPPPAPEKKEEPKPEPAKASANVTTYEDGFKAALAQIGNFNAVIAEAPEAARPQLLKDFTAADDIRVVKAAVSYAKAMASKALGESPAVVTAQAQADAKAAAAKLEAEASERFEKSSSLQNYWAKGQPKGSKEFEDGKARYVKASTTPDDQCSVVRAAQ